MFGLNWLTGGLAIWAVIGPLLGIGVTWSSMRLRETLVVQGARKAERAEQIGICALQLAEQANTLTANTVAGIGEAGAAADAIPVTPEVASALAALCKSDRACRDRGTLP
jgi:hypothetical protein